MSGFLMSENVYLKKLSEADISEEYIRGINSQELDVHTTHSIYPKSKDDLIQYLKQKNSQKDLWLGIFEKANDKHIGNIELSEINHLHSSAKFSIILWSEQGKGFGKQAGRLILSHAFSRLNLNRVELGVNQNNAGAMGLYESLGFVKEGILRQALVQNGKKQNVVIMSCLAEEFVS